MTDTRYGYCGYTIIVKIISNHLIALLFHLFITMMGRNVHFIIIIINAVPSEKLKVLFYKSNNKSREKHTMLHTHSKN